MGRTAVTPPAVSRLLLGLAAIEPFILSLTEARVVDGRARVAGSAVCSRRCRNSTCASMLADALLAHVAGNVLQSAVRWIDARASSSTPVTSQCSGPHNSGEKHHGRGVFAEAYRRWDDPTVHPLVRV